MAHMGKQSRTNRHKFQLVCKAWQVASVYRRPADCTVWDHEVDMKRRSLFYDVLWAFLILATHLKASAQTTFGSYANKCSVECSSFSNADIAKERIVYFIAAPQGNGFNWSATLSWLGHSLRETIGEATNPLRPTIVEFGGFSASSSGSGVASVLMSLLENPSFTDLSKERQSLYQLRSEFPGRIFVSTETALRVANGLIFAALGADTDLMTLVSVLRGAGRSRFQGARQKIGTFIRGEKHATLKWDGLAQPQDILNTFGEIATSMLTIPWAKIDQDESKVSDFTPFLTTLARRPELARKVSMDGRRKIYEIPEINSSTLHREDLKFFENYMAAKSRAVRRILSAEIGTRNLQEALFRPLLNGFSINAFVFLHSKSNMATAGANKEARWDYREMRILTLMNSETAHRLISSPAYLNSLKDPNSYLRRYVIGIVETRADAMNMSVREPQLNPLLFGKLSNMKVSAFYDPESSRQVALESTSGSEVSAVVIGGFPVQEMTIRPILALSAIGIDTLNQFVQKNSNFAIRNQLNLFGFPALKNGEEGFQQKQIRSYLSTPSTAISNIEEFRKFKMSLYSDLPSLISKISWNLTEFNWDQVPKKLSEEDIIASSAWRLALEAALHTKKAFRGF